MNKKVSNRLLEIIDALPLKNGMRILEIGCGPGVAAKEIASRFKNSYVLAIDRSATAIAQARRKLSDGAETGNLTFLQSNIEEFELPENEECFDLAFAIRVGALDGRHPGIEEAAIRNIKKALKKNGKLFTDGGDPLKEIKLK